MPFTPTTRAVNPASLETNFRQHFVEKYNVIRTLRQRLFNIVSSDKASEIDARYAGLGLFYPKAEGAPFIYDGGKQMYTRRYTAQTWGLGVQITREAMKDDKNNILASMGKGGTALAKVAQYTLERNSMSVYNNAESATIYTYGGTNYPLLSTAHPLADGDTYPNRFTVNMDVSPEAFDYAIEFWMQYAMNLRGQLVDTLPRKIVSCVSNHTKIERILKTVDGRQGSADKDYNTAGARNWEHITHPLMVNDGRWFLQDEEENTGLTIVMREDPTVLPIMETPQHDYVIHGVFRCDYGASSPEGIIGSL